MQTSTEKLVLLTNEKLVLLTNEKLVLGWHLLQHANLKN
jgi:hypothetical protein